MREYHLLIFFADIRMKHFSLRSVVLVLFLSMGTVVLSPVSLAQEATGEAQQGADQGMEQGIDQGTDQGGPSLESLGLTPDENGNYDTSVLGDNDPRQGALQGSSQGTTNGTTVEASNENTGADSTNSASSDTSNTSSTSTNNTSATTNTATGTAGTGGNAADENTGPGSVSTGNAGVGVQQVTADNLNTSGSQTEVSHTTSGTQNGDLNLNFNPQPYGGDTVDSFTSTNTVTGSGSDNAVTINHTTETINEIQNDGTIDNTLNAGAVTGQNSATQNTGDATIATGDANVAATLLNFLNTNVVDGTLWLEVVDIFGDLNGNVVISEDVIQYLERRQRELIVGAENSETGANSTNSVDVDVTNEQSTGITNNADVTNNVTVDAITGQNTATQNTGGSTIDTGDVQATTNTVTLANLNVVDGNLGLIIVNAFNRWMAYLLGSDGSWTPISHEYTAQILAENSQTGADSTNTVDVDVTNTDETSIENTARVNNDVNLSAITGQNTANQNTGDASITTGDARVNANVVNVVNTNVVRGNLFIAIINVFGNWFGDVLFGGNSISSLAQGGSGGGVTVDGGNTNTGADSTNTIDVDANSTQSIDVENTAAIENNMRVNADTGHNQANRNTGLGSVTTGDALAALHARNIANVTLAGLGDAWSNVTADLVNGTTGADSTNTIDVTVNDERNVSVANDASVDTTIGAVANTGFNQTNRNTLGGVISTGRSILDVVVENLLNQTWIVGGPPNTDPSVNVASANSTTGANSTNSTSVTPTSTTTIDLDNTANVNTDVTADATTGNNEANENTGDGVISTKKASIDGDLDNTVNQTAVEGTILGSLFLNAANAAEIDNTFDANASSGGNEANRNTGMTSSTPPTGGGNIPDNGGSNPPQETPGSSDDNGDSSSDDSDGGVGGGSDEPETTVASSSSKVGAQPKKPAMEPRVLTAERVARPVFGAIGRGIIPRAIGALGRISAIGPVEAAAAETGKQTTPGLASLSESRSIGDIAARVWPWAALAGALALFARMFGAWGLIGGIARRRKDNGPR